MNSNDLNHVDTMHRHYHPDEKVDWVYHRFIEAEARWGSLAVKEGGRRNERRYARIRAAAERFERRHGLDFWNGSKHKCDSCARAYREAQAVCPADFPAKPDWLAAFPEPLRWRDLLV